MTRPRIGVLALQGDVSEHLHALAAANAEPGEVRKAQDLAGVDALVIPGGESTTVGKLLDRYDLLRPIKSRIDQGMPVYGTCTGLILLAQDVEDGLPGQPVLGTMDVTAKRNAFGRQVDSFEADLDVAGFDTPFHAVFIRAPQITRTGPGVEVLARHGDRVVAARDRHMLATAFHPELTGDTRLHALFVDMVTLCPTHP